MLRLILGYCDGPEMQRFNQFLSKSIEELFLIDCHFYSPSKVVNFLANEGLLSQESENNYTNIVRNSDIQHVHVVNNQQTVLNRIKLLREFYQDFQVKLFGNTRTSTSCENTVRAESPNCETNIDVLDKIEQLSEIK